MRALRSSRVEERLAWKLGPLAREEAAERGGESKFREGGRITLCGEGLRSEPEMAGWRGSLGERGADPRLGMWGIGVS